MYVSVYVCVSFFFSSLFRYIKSSIRSPRSDQRCTSAAALVERACMHACVHACVRACVRACLRACVRACVRASVRTPRHVSSRRNLNTTAWAGDTFVRLFDLEKRKCERGNSVEMI